MFGFLNVWTQKGNIFCIFEGKRHRIHDFVPTSGMVSAIFFPMLAKYALRFSEIAAGLVITSPVLAFYLNKKLRMR